MAISANANVLANLKTYYKDGVQSLFFRNDPVIKQLKSERVEGKSANFEAIAGTGGASSSSYTACVAAASTVSTNVEFKVTPGQIFSVYEINAKEVQASLTKRGAYMKAAGLKMFASTEAFRRNVATAFYGRGYGELCYAPAQALIANTSATIALSADAMYKVDQGVVLAVKASVESNTVLDVLTITAVDMDANKVTVTPASTYTMIATDVICLANSMDSAGNPLMPMGLAGWLPNVGGRTGTAWTNYINTSFFGVNRSANATKLAGQFVQGGASDKVSDVIKRLIKKCRNGGSEADLIIMNPDDMITLDNEVAATSMFFTQTSTKQKKNATVGTSDFAAAFSTNYIDNIVDTPYCPAGKIYVLEKDMVENWSYTNVDTPLNNGVAGNNPGKQDPMSMDNAGKEDEAYKLIIDDYITVQPGIAGVDGPVTDVGIQYFGSFVVLNPVACGVALLNGYAGL